MEGSKMKLSSFLFPKKNPAVQHPKPAFYMVIPQNRSTKIIASLTLAMTRGFVRKPSFPSNQVVLETLQFRRG
jgi:hypothetical protein